MRQPRFRVRISDTDDPELYCYGCQDWLPISLEYWPFKNTFWRCRSCENDRMKLYHAMKMMDPAFRFENAMKSARYREYVRQHDLMAAVQAEHRERVNLAARVKRAA